MKKKKKNVSHDTCITGTVFTEIILIFIVSWDAVAKLLIASRMSKE